MVLCFRVNNLVLKNKQNINHTDSYEKFCKKKCALFWGKISWVIFQTGPYHKLLSIVT